MGAELSPGLVESWRPTPNAPTRVLESDWRDSRVRVCWRLERGGLMNGIVSISTGFAKVLQGRYALQNAAGESLGGISVTDLTVWRIRNALRQLGAEEGDVLELLFDPAQKTCRIRVGDLEQIESELLVDEDDEADDGDE